MLHDVPEYHAEWGPSIWASQDCCYVTDGRLWAVDPKAGLVELAGVTFTFQ